MMIRNIAISALGAGCAAWLLAALLHFAFIQNYILLGESYESGAPTHFHGAAPAVADRATERAKGAAQHHHAIAPADGAALSRDLWTIAFFGLVYVAYALILVAGFGLARTFDRTITAREGLLWGIAGYATFQLAPAMGLAPQLPGSLAADLGARQVWWWGAVASTALGLALLGYGRGIAVAVVALALLAVPHVLGAPQAEGFNGTAPSEVAAAFAARVLGVGLVVWAVMGWVAGHLWARTSERPA